MVDPLLITPVPDSTAVKCDGRIARKRATREALLKAAAEVFLEKGYRATTIDDIGQRANVAHGTFYGHFKGKEDVLLHVLDDLASALRTCLEGSPYTPASLTDLHTVIKSQIFGLIRLYLDWQPLLRVLRQAMGESPAVRNAWRQIVGLHLRSRTEEDIRYSQAHGLYRDVDARLAAACIGSLTGHFLWRLVEGQEPAENAELIAETITDLYLHGMYLEHH